MEEMESQIREEIRKGNGLGPCRAGPPLSLLGDGFSGHSWLSACPPGFAELQTDMTDLTKELNRSQGIPFLEYKHFVTRTFFPKVSSSLSLPLNLCQPPQGNSTSLSPASLEGPLSSAKPAQLSTAVLATCPGLPRGGGLEADSSLLFSAHLMFNCPHGSQL